jgi:two-component system NtrC family sensor kinase
MRKLLFIIFFIPVITLAKPWADTVINIDHFDPNGFTLKTGWKFKNGDNPDFAKVAYDDHAWQSIDPALPMPKMPASAQRGIGWLRIKLHISPAFRQTAALRIVSIAAVEVYFNGRLVRQEGTINNVRKTGRGYAELSNPIDLPEDTNAVQVLAIRFANQPSLSHYNRYLQPPLLGAAITNTPQLLNYIRTNELRIFSMLVGVSILSLLAVFHLTLWRYHNSNRANLYFACYAICYALFLILSIRKYYPTYIDEGFFMGLASSVFFLTSALFGTKALCLLFGFKPGVYYRVLIITAVLGFIGAVFIEQFVNNLSTAVAITVIAAELWLTLKAVWHKRRGAPIVAAGFLVGLAGLIFYYHVFQGTLLLPVVTAICLTTLGPPIAISLFLGREFALDSQLLALKLHEVEELSAANIAQEQEKLRILASQNETLEIRVTERTTELNETLNNLRQTQTQLIQSEKMASLGELTAGIAHEIQNPLNFVNNFSEVNKEMLLELETEIKNGNTEDALALTTDIIQNEEKINHHGKRADAIVKGMLQHSQSGSGTKEPTNINTLADECMRLAYHGLRAKDKSFNSELVSHLDETLPKVTVIPQDIVRVMLNLFNNAFYAVNQKQQGAGEDYKPEVSLTTSAENWQVIIKVKDNGIGIPDAIKDKIMQPFFTTKPTGEGTGLGLSLTYDMIAKGHGGSIQVNSVEGEGSEFIVNLPIQLLNK